MSEYQTIIGSIKVPAGYRLKSVWAENLSDPSHAVVVPCDSVTEEWNRMKDKADMHDDMVDREVMEWVEKKEAAPTPIDLSCLEGSDVDCEFWGDSLDDTEIGLLYHIHDDDSIYEYELKVDARVARYRHCRPRHNKRMAHDGSECPLPDGLRVRIFQRNLPREGKEVCITGVPAHLWRWSWNYSDHDIIAYRS